MSTSPVVNTVSSVRVEISPTEITSCDHSKNNNEAGARPSALHIDCIASTSVSFTNDVQDLVKHCSHIRNLSEEDKDLMILIQNHPLYCVLEILTIQCEKATWTLNHANTVINSDKIMRRYERELKRKSAGYCGDREVDNLMLNAIAVLRIHLIELSKVEELCLDFQQRYSLILKSRVSQESLLGIVGESADESMHMHEQAMHAGLMASISTRTGIVNVSLQSAPTVNQNLLDVEMCEVVDEGSTDSEDTNNHKSISLPRTATDVLKQWLFKNVTNPYPSVEEKDGLCLQTGLSGAQLNNWFINARRRILQPLPDVNFKGERLEKAQSPGSLKEKIRRLD